MSIKSGNWEKIRRIIRQGQLGKAAEALRKETHQHPDLYDTLVVLDGQLEEFQRKRAAGLLDPKEEARQHAQLSAGLLQVTRLIEQREAAEQPRRKKLYWLLAVSLAILVFGGAYFQLQQKQLAEKEAYQLALDQNTVPACTQFLEDYPASKHQSEVEQKLRDLNRQFEQYLQSARAMQRAGEPEKALEFAQKALEIQPEQPDVLQFLKNLPK